MNGREFPKVGIYFSHYECFGHISRVIAVGEVFKKRFPCGDIFSIQAGVRQPRAAIGQLGRVYSLPAAFMDRQSFRKPVPGPGANAGRRGKVCMDIVAHEKPDFFITEFFPLGRGECRHELIPTLVKASKQGSILLGVAGYPLLTGTDHEWREKVLRLYARIIIFAPPVEKRFIAASFPGAEDRQRYLEFFERNSRKIKFAGYLLPRQEVVCDDNDGNLPKPFVSKEACRVAVVRGGGAVYPKVIAAAIRASDSLGKEYCFTVVAGPATTPQEWYFFATLVGKKKVHNLVLLRSVSHYEGLIERSDVCVSMASYHTSVMFMKHRKKAVVIPFEGYGSMSHREQPARAAILREIIGAKILSMQNLTANTLMQAVKDAEESQDITSQIPKEWFNGADSLDHALTELLPR